MTQIVLALFAAFTLLSPLGRAQAPDSFQASDTTSPVDVAAQSYAQKCAGCDTVGEGKLTGPDLLPTRAWPKPELAAKIKLMEPRVGPLSENELAQLVGAIAGFAHKIAFALLRNLPAKPLQRHLNPHLRASARSYSKVRRS